jgi:phage terminase large subunit-like protein
LPHSLRAQVAKEVLPKASEAEAELLHYVWELWARDNQLIPEWGEWRTWLLMKGRGEGKTRSGAEWSRTQLEEMPGCRVAIIARTIADARDTCVEGESGLLSCFPPDERKLIEWNRSQSSGRLPNGSSWQCFSSEKPDSLRGPQFHVAWCDELAAWLKHRAAWQQVPFIVRLPWPAAPHRAGRVVVTTTPRPFVELRQLIADKLTRTVTGRTSDNWGNLNELTRAALERLKGTRIGRQELDAEMLDDVPGALWQRSQLDAFRIDKAPELTRVVVAIDPAASVSEDSDETGIIGAGRDKKGKCYCLADRSGRYKPTEWAQRAVDLYRELEADFIVAEVNNGGDMVEATLRAVDKTVKVVKVHASRGKQTRAEPISTAAELGNVVQVGVHERLEDQLCTWTPDSGDSPDRLDAYVWAMTSLRAGVSGEVPKIVEGVRTGVAAMQR